MTRARPIKSSAYTLIEMLVLITSVSAFMLLAGILVQSLLRLDRTERSAQAEAASASRLAKAFREDAHAAASATVEADGFTVRFPRGANRRVSYQSAPGEIVRLESAGEKTFNRERFRMPARVRPRFSISGESARKLAAVRFETSPASIDPPGLFRGLKVEAEVGRLDRISGVRP